MIDWEILLSIYLTLKLCAIAIGIICVIISGLIIFLPEIIKFVRNKKNDNNRN